MVPGPSQAFASSRIGSCVVQHEIDLLSVFSVALVGQLLLTRTTPVRSPRNRQRKTKYQGFGTTRETWLSVAG